AAPPSVTGVKLASGLTSHWLTLPSGCWHTDEPVHAGVPQQNTITAAALHAPCSQRSPGLQSQAVVHDEGPPSALKLPARSTAPARSPLMPASPVRSGGASPS